MHSWRVRDRCMTTPDRIAVSVVLAQPHRQFVVHLSVTQGTTVAEAVAQSSLTTRLPEDEASQLNCAIYGRAVALSQPVTAGDRIEILRPLRLDPKERRRTRARIDLTGRR